MATRKKKAPNFVLKTAPDFYVSGQGGSIVLIYAVSDQVREWLLNNVHSEMWQWVGEALAVDWRFAEDIVEALTDEGFINGSES